MKTNLLTTIIVIGMILIAGGAYATTYYVNPGQSIQAAVNGAVNGDVIILKPGVHPYPGVNGRGIYFDGKAITVKSEDGAPSTIIDCQGLGRAFSFKSNEGPNTVIDGLTIKNAGGKGSGAIYIYSSSPTIKNCIITSNNSRGSGGGILCWNSSPTIINCTIVGNSAVRSGGGIYAGGVGSSPTIRNCILYWNSPFEVGVEDGATPIFEYCNIRGGAPLGIGCIDIDPWLTWDFHIKQGSPMIDHCPTGTTTDMNGESRPVGSAYDIGADEYIDMDNDGLPDWLELHMVGSATSADPMGDEDLDSLANIWEYEHGTDAGNPDSDGDGRGDAVEVGEWTHPVHPDNTELTYYVNGSTGNNAYDGLAAVWDGIHGPKATIQAGVNCTLNIWGHTVLVAPGTYTGPGNLNISLLGHDVTVKSQAGAATTIIDCQSGSRSRGFDLKLGEDNNTVIDGFWIKNANHDKGGGIMCEGSGPTIKNCLITDCIVTFGGGGIASFYTGKFNSQTQIINCTIIGNRGGVWGGGGIYCLDSSPTIKNSILWGNSPDEVAVNSWATSAPYSIYCDVQNGTGRSWFGTGCIDEDPRLTPDYHLLVASPCIDQCPTGTASDMDGESRPTGAAYDMGADEVLDPTDTDGDGLPDWLELELVGSTTGAEPDGDEDGDSLTNLWEYHNGTDPENPDSDGDGRNDGQEIADGTNPWHPDNIEMTYYVNANTGNDTYDGLAAVWDGVNGPKATIGAGIDCTLYSVGHTVLVAAGTYTGEGNRGIKLNGKDIVVKSEDGAESTIIDCQYADRAFEFSNGEDTATVLDGFTIQNGSPPSMGGGAIYCYQSSPAIKNCIFKNCSDAFYCLFNCSPVIQNCTFTNNDGAFNMFGGNPTFTDCTFSNNSADNGAGLYMFSGNPTLTNCTFSGNSATGDGGGICNSAGTLELIDCTFSGNSAGGNGGGIFIADAATLTNCVLNGNSATNGGGMATVRSGNPIAILTNCLFVNNSASSTGAGVYNGKGSMTLTNCTFGDNLSPIGNAIANGEDVVAILANCILWDGGNEVWNDPLATDTVTYSCVQGGYSGTGNIADDPLFVSGPMHDYYLSQINAGQAATSPCVDAGSGLAVDLGLDGLTTRTDGLPDSGTIDMGYHSFLGGDIGDIIVYFTDIGSSTYEAEEETVSIQVALTSSSASTITVPYTVSGTAEGGGVDYSDPTPASPIVFLPGETLKQIQIPIIDDPDYEPGEVVLVTLDTPTNAIIMGSFVHTLTIVDQEGYIGVQFSSPGSSTNEADEEIVTIQVALTSSSDSTITVPYTVSGTAEGGGVDYSGPTPASPVVFLPGEPLKQIQIPIIDDPDYEDGEVVLVTLGTPTNAIIMGSFVHTLTIVDQEDYIGVRFSSPGSSTNEEDTDAVTIQITLTSSSDLVITVPYTVSGTAEGGGVDYTGPTPASPIVFSPGETLKEIQIWTVDDDVFKSNRTVEVALGTPTNAELDMPSLYTLMIIDDDVAGAYPGMTLRGSWSFDETTGNVFAGGGIQNQALPVYKTATGGPGTDDCHHPGFTNNGYAGENPVTGVQNFSYLNMEDEADSYLFSSGADTELIIECDFYMNANPERQRTLVVHNWDSDYGLHVVNYGAFSGEPNPGGLGAINFVWLGPDSAWGIFESRALSIGEWHHVKVEMDRQPTQTVLNVTIDSIAEPTYIGPAGDANAGYPGVLFVNGWYDNGPGYMPQQNWGMIDNLNIWMGTLIPVIDSIKKNGDNIVLHWNAQPGVSYIVQWSNDLVTWNDVPVGQTNTWTDTDIASYTRKYYRIKEE